MQAPLVDVPAKCLHFPHEINHFPSQIPYFCRTHSKPAFPLFVSLMSSVLLTSTVVWHTVTIMQMAGSRPRSSSTLSRASASHSSRPQTAGRSRPSPVPASSCPLDDPDMGLVAMTDHQNRRCLCAFCTCGRHKCPGEVILTPYPRNMFASAYQQTHRPKSPIRPIDIPRNERRVIQAPMEMLTHNELAYRPFRVSLQSNQTAVSSGKPRPQSAGPHPKFAGASTYHMDFMNWGSSHPYHVKQRYEQVPTQDLSFAGQSEYGKHYQEKDLKGLRGNNGGADEHSSLTLHGSGIKLETRTTNKEEFRAVLGVHKAESCKVTTVIPNLQAVPGAYSTEYKAQYVPRSPLLKNPQTIRRFLLTKGF